MEINKSIISVVMSKEEAFMIYRLLDNMAESSFGDLGFSGDDIGILNSIYEDLLDGGVSDGV